MVPDVATWYPLVDGGAVLARPFVSADALTSAADKISFVFILPEQTYTQTFEWTRTTIGREIEGVEVVASKPSRGRSTTPSQRCLGHRQVRRTLRTGRPR